MKDSSPNVDSPEWLAEVRFDANGLIPAIAQDATSGDILMMAWMNAEALTATATEGQAIYWSRSRNKLWRKGESSGHQQRVLDIRLDCDADVILLKVEQRGGIACHTGRRSCFYRRLEQGRWEVTDPVLKDPDTIYRPHPQQGD
ncbi:MULTISPECIES: phosphoribosyl-AMP cyclohydrolase [Marinobacter]|uniref:phosphoribosyl-AMP cyclohydrolase n=1 Tax=Marinobacter TaxID=2742 RepID=UPI001D071EB2|nr:MULTISPECIES: phosphoribosyl-AMP cyclohydrolase [Marinobacter]MCG8516870.1 phosphoribosyl-AMP cyclohydrolase [Pseudomonadales bacterium]MCK7568357.1 phosphoribosyl-AMP cyclohydrolase [Marinobacter xestospongiae]UDL04508.1 phosphoribosyl-AMP cyclohydrolase [Marinobacter sp. CA1]